MENKEKYIWFVIISLLALAGFFIIFNSFEYDMFKNDQNEVVVDGDTEDVLMSKDPFITKASDWYKSFVKPHNLVMDNGDIPVIAFCDFTQHECGGLWNRLKEMKDKGLPIMLAWKHFPLPTNSVSRSASKAVICAEEQNAFWEFTELIFKKSSPLEESNFSAMIEALGLDIEKFESCFNEQDVVELIGQDMEDTQSLRVNTFPYVIIGSERLDSGEMDMLEETIQDKI
jgi:2-hydroxychromene-2-carboxylate isomerase